jgi:hypothetical protein
MRAEQRALAEKLIAQYGSVDVLWVLWAGY